MIVLPKIMDYIVDGKFDHQLDQIVETCQKRAQIVNMDAAARLPENLPVVFDESRCPARSSGFYGIEGRVLGRSGSVGNVRVRIAPGTIPRYTGPNGRKMILPGTVWTVPASWLEPLT